MIDDFMLMLVASRLREIEATADRAAAEEMRAQFEYSLTHGDANSSGYPSSDDELNLLVAYLASMRGEEDVNELPPELHSALLERIARAPAVLSRRWLSEHVDQLSAPRRMYLQREGRPSDSIARVCAEVGDAFVRHQCVSVALTFDAWEASSAWPRGSDDPTVTVTVARRVLAQSAERELSRAAGELTESLLDAWADPEFQESALSAVASVVDIARRERRTDALGEVRSVIVRHAQLVGGEEGERLRTVLEWGWGPSV